MSGVSKCERANKRTRDAKVRERERASERVKARARDGDYMKRRIKDQQ